MKIKTIAAALRAYLSLGVIVSPLPYTIVNGQAIDAGPVQANFDWLLNQVNTNVPPLIPVVGPLTAFTPSLKFGGASAGMVYSFQVGQYYKVGSLVNFWIFIDISNRGASAGAATIEGLPFTISNSMSSNYPCVMQTSFIDPVGPGGGTVPIATLVPNTTTLALMTIIPATATGALNNANFNGVGGSFLRISGMYLS